MRFLFVISFLILSSSLFAQSSARVKNLEIQRKKLLEEVDTTNRLLAENKKTTGNALNRLNLLTQQVLSRKQIIALLNQELTALDEDIVLKEREVKNLEKNLQQKKDSYAEAIKKIYSRKSSRNNLLFVLSADDFSQSYRRILYLREYSNWKKDQANEITQKQEIVNLQKEILLRNKEEKNNLLQERRNEETQLIKEESTQKSEVQSLQKDRKKLQNELAQKQKQANALNKEIERIIAEEVAKSRKEAEAKSGGKARTAETKGGYAMTKEEQNLSSNFASNKGKLPFPLKGAYKVVEGFGVHQHKELKNVSVNNSGIDIETTRGNEACSVFNGVVSRVFTIPGSTYSVIIRHGNYLTLYSNIETVYVKQGDSVKTGQTLGKIYTDPSKGNSTLLHFQIWKDTVKQNPLSWLNR